MTIKDIIGKLINRGNDEQMNEEAHRRRIQRILDTKEMNSNERELIRFQEEERQENIKQALEYYRKKRKEDIDFNHNALDTPYIMESEWKVLKEKNQFSGNKNMFVNQPNIFKGKSIFMKD